MSISYDQFVAAVKSVFPGAEYRGHFRDYSPEFVNCAYNPDRKYYTWQDGFEGCSYDTLISDKRWMIQIGRGTVGYGDTIEEAVKDEKNAYDDSFFNRVD